MAGRRHPDFRRSGALGRKQTALFEKSPSAGAAQKLLRAGGVWTGIAVNRFRWRRLTASSAPKPGREAAKSFFGYFFFKKSNFFLL
jgi:hypothetical protein